MQRVFGRRPATEGQVLVMFAGGLLLLIAIAALVIDLGFVFMLRRQEQNAADPAAIAAARYIRAPGGTQAMMKAAACDYLRMNGFFQNDAACTDEVASPYTRLRVNYPPSAAAGEFMGRKGFVEVSITRRHESFFGRAVGIGSIDVSSSAVAAYSAGDSNSNSLIALNLTQCASAKISGTNTAVTITPSTNPATGLPYDGGYVHVNSTCGSPPMKNNLCETGSGSDALKIDSSGSSLTAPHVYVAGTCGRSTNNTFNSSLTEGAVQIGDPLANLAPPRIGDYPAGRCGPTGPFTGPNGNESKGCDFPAGETLLDPGVYYGGWKIGNNTTIKMSPGIYIIAGGGVTVTGTGSLESVSGDPTVDARVMIFSTDNPIGPCSTLNQSQKQGPLDFTANSTFNAKALASGPYRGILIWQDGKGCDAAAPVSLGGQTNLNIAGTIYAPKAPVTLTGGSAGTGVASVQIIADQWTVTGGATLTMPYDPKELYRLEQKGLVR